MKQPRFYLLLLLVPLAMPVKAEGTFSLRQEPGPFAVGLKIVEQYDYSRTFHAPIDELGKPYQGERARPMQTLVWYPAERNSGKSVVYGDYYDLRKTETSFGKPQVSVGFADQFMAGIDPGQPMWAMRNAAAATGRFPVVIYAPSATAYSFENADLCEYLASHGYLVIASPGMGVLRRSSNDLAGMDAQARDISFLIGYARRLPAASVDVVTVVGFSWGGISNLLAAARDNRIGAMVDLDGSIRYWPGLIKSSTEVHPEQMTLPTLAFTSQSSIETQDQLEANNPVARGPSVLNAYTHGDLITVSMLGLVHPQFNSMTQRSNWYFDHEFPAVQLADYSRDDGVAGYAWVARYTRAFLDAYIKHDSAAMQFLKNPPAQNRVPAHVMGVSFRAAQPLPPTLDDFKASVGRNGFDHAGDLYAEMRKERADFRLDARAVSTWGYDLLADNRVTEAVPIMRLAVEIDASSEEYAAVAEAYLRSDHRQLAIDNYRKALELVPGNPFIKQTLEELEGQSPRR
jgi:dienelactone hydrolase